MFLEWSLFTKYDSTNTIEELKAGAEENKEKGIKETKYLMDNYYPGLLLQAASKLSNFPLDKPEKSHLLQFINALESKLFGASYRFHGCLNDMHHIAIEAIDRIEQSNQKIKQLEQENAALKTELANYKTLDPTQKTAIQKAVHERVYSLLDIPLDRDEREDSEHDQVNAYASLFHQRCYSEVSNLGHLARPYEKTLSKDFDAAIADIKTWTPEQGIDSLKQEAEQNSRQRIVASSLAQSASAFTFQSIQSINQ